MNLNLALKGHGCKENSFKFVGVKIDEFLLWKDHINSIRSKLSSATFALSKVKNILPESSKLTIYNSLFRCHLEYCNIAWGNCNSSLLMQLQKLQKKSLRHIANKKANSHVNPLYKKYNLLNVKDSINYNFGVFMYQYTYDSLPCSFTNLFTKLHTHDRNLNYKTNFVKPHCLKSNPMNRMPNLWNSLNLDLKRSRSLSIFKNNLTKYFHDQYDVKCNVHNCFACN